MSRVDEPINSTEDLCSIIMWKVESPSSTPVAVTQLLLVSLDTRTFSKPENARNQNPRIDTQGWSDDSLAKQEETREIRQLSEKREFPSEADAVEQEVKA